MKRALALIALACATLAGPAEAARHGHSASRQRCVGCRRDARGRIRRSPKARADFKKTHPCPATGKTSGPCPGYVIDHIVPLKRGGPDTPANMQWQTKAAAKAKDRVE